MTTAARIWLSAGLLGAALAVQAGLLGHMILGPSNSYPTLRKSFGDLPTTLPVEAAGAPTIVWSCAAHPAEKRIRQELPFAPIDLVFRFCRAADLNVDAECYIVHSANGEDRKHHPEICIRDVQGVPEVQSDRLVVQFGDPKHDRKAQRYCFKRGETQTTTVYYWHYTFVPEMRDEQTWLQMLHQTFSRFPPSVTVQVTTTAARDRWPIIEKALLAPLDEHLRSHYLPDGVIMGCDRLPIAMAVN